MIAQDVLFQLFDYKDGKLLHKITHKNSVKAGSIVGTKDKDGYLKTLIKRKPYRVHRLIWIMHYGYEPKILDHINCVPDDNRIENLREATHSQNNLNRNMHNRNTTGFKGISYIKDRQLYRASLMIDGVKHVFGHYKTAEEAYAIYCQEVKNRCGQFGRI
jgi:hypothetical protein